jgi:WD40 repeat protein
VYLFDRVTGQVIRRIGSFPSEIFSLSISKDGHRIAIGLASAGLKVVSLTDGSILFSDSEFKDSVYGLDFNASGQLAVCCDDGTVCAYSSDYRRTKKVLQPNGIQPRGLKFSPDGQRIAVGDAAKPGILVLATDSLEQLFSVDTDRLTGPVPAVEWSSDGTSLSAAGLATSGLDFIIRTWPDGGKGSPEDTKVSRNTVESLVRLPDGGLAFSAADRFGLVDKDHKVTSSHNPAIDPRGLDRNFRLNRDGCVAVFKFRPFERVAHTFSITERSITTTNAGDLSETDTVAPLLESQSLSVTNWRNSADPKVNNIRLGLVENEISRSLAILPDSSGFILGTDFRLYCFGRDGKQKWPIRETPGAAWSVNVSGDGRVVVAAFDDGTIRWYRASDGEPLLALYVHPERHLWVLWTPAGYYDCSPGGEELIGWSVNNGADHEADFYSADQFRDAFYRPDVVQRVLSKLDVSKALTSANLASSRIKAAPVAEILPPIVGGLTSDLAGEKLDVHFKIHSQTSEPVVRIDAYVNGVLVKSELNLQLNVREGITREIVLDAAPGTSSIAIQAWNRYAPSVLARLDLAAKRATPSTGGDVVVNPKKGRLWVFSVGVGEFKTEKSLRLNLPAKDAHDFTATMQAQRGLYSEVKSRVLSDENGTKRAILDGFQWLRDNVQPGDVTMIFLSGHGMQDRDQSYYYLPSDYESGSRIATAVNFSDLAASVSVLRTRGYVYVFLDTCHASAALGSMDSTGLSSGLAAPGTGAIVLSACQANQTAIEDPKWQNGAFTKVLLDAINSGAIVDDEGQVSLAAIEVYLQNEVPKLVGKDHPQVPTIQIPGATPKLVLAKRPH